VSYEYMSIRGVCMRACVRVCVRVCMSHFLAPGLAPLFALHQLCRDASVP